MSSPLPVRLLAIVSALAISGQNSGSSSTGGKKAGRLRFYRFNSLLETQTAKVPACQSLVRPCFPACLPAWLANNPSLQHDLSANTSAVHRFLRAESRTHVRAEFSRCAAGRSDVAVHQRGDESVQADLSRYGEACLFPRRQHTEVHSRRRKAQ